MELGLNGRVAVIVGGSTGIERATALRLAAEGTHLSICARRAEILERLTEEIGGSGVQLMTVAADVSRGGEVEQFISATAKRFGRIDILVNNAGSTSQGPFAEADDAKWQYDLEVKLMAQVRASRAVLPLMRAQGQGRIINISMAGAKQP